MKVKLRALLLILLTSSGMSYSQPAEEYLSIQETIELAKREYYDFIPAEAIAKSKRANPLARPYLYEILNDTNQQKIWPQVVGAFAYLGQNEDVPRLEEFLLTQKGFLNNYKFNAVMMVFDVLGAMTARKKDSAMILQMKMFEPAYWNNVKFVVYENKPDIYPEFKNYMVLKAFAGYVYANDPRYSEMADTIYNRIFPTLTNQEEKKFLVKNINGLKQNDKEIKKRKGN